MISNIIVDLFNLVIRTIFNSFSSFYNNHYRHCEEKSYWICKRRESFQNKMCEFLEISATFSEWRIYEMKIMLITIWVSEHQHIKL